MFGKNDITFLLLLKLFPKLFPMNTGGRDDRSSYNTSMKLDSTRFGTLIRFKGGNPWEIPGKSPTIFYLFFRFTMSTNASGSSSRTSNMSYAGTFATDTFSLIQLGGRHARGGRVSAVSSAQSSRQTSHEPGQRGKSVRAGMTLAYAL